MASERSIYNKIYQVLKIANSFKSNKSNDLRKHIEGIAPTIFKTYQYSKELDDLNLTFSLKVLDKILLICKNLFILDDQNIITKLGIEALDLTKFNEIVANQIYLLFEQNGIDIEKLNIIIKECFLSIPPIMPTSKIIWEIAKIEMPLFRFSQYLNILYQCNHAQVSQKKLYLLISPS